MMSATKVTKATRAPFATRAMLWLSTGKRVDGLWIGTYFQTNAEVVMQRLEAALDLIKASDPRRYGRIVRDLDRVWVRLVPGTIGHFDASLRACVIDERFVLRDTTTPEMIAITIVHEATHARLDRCGIAYEEAARPRIEQICFRRELAFVRRLPNGEAVRDWVAQSTQLAPDTWTNASLEKTDVDGSEQVLQHLGYPAWLTRAIMAVRRRRGRTEGGR